jgi:hypothetical protein
MAFSFGNSIVTEGLTLYLDALNPSSYPGSGTTWYDLSSTKNDGTLTGATLPIYNNKSFFFNGSTSYVTNFPTQIAGTGTKTISAFICPYSNSIDGGRVVAGTYNNVSGDSFLMLGYNGVGQIRYGNGVIDVSNLFQPNEWFNVTVTHDASITKGVMYKNGVQVGINNSIPLLGAGTISGSIGAQGNAGRIFSGSIGVIQIYNRALSPAEVRQNFNSLKGRFNL